jgi:hypothetical protein
MKITRGILDDLKAKVAKATAEHLPEQYYFTDTDWKVLSTYVEIANAIKPLPTDALKIAKKFDLV